jgi:hypothetical protein
MNEDYVKGIRFLLKETKERGINIRKVQWIPNVSKMLSERNLCYRFWYNVAEQGNLNRLPLCETWFDILYGCKKWLFIWLTTEEGSTFWKSHLWEMLGLDDSYFGFVEELKGMRLQ